MQCTFMQHRKLVLSTISALSHSTCLFHMAMDNCEASYLHARDLTLGPSLQTFVWCYATQSYDSLSSKASCHSEAGMKPAEPAHPRQPPFGPFPEVTNTLAEWGGEESTLPASQPCPCNPGPFAEAGKAQAMKWSHEFPAAVQQQPPARGHGSV